MFLSVEISSYNRGDILLQGLARLAQQTLPADRFEVVVSDDGSTNDTPDRVEAFAKTAPYALRVLRNAHAGCGMTHNAGIRAARGELVLMMADDVLPTPRMLEEHVRLHERHPEENVGVVGRQEQSPMLPQTPLQRFWDRVVNELHFARPRNRLELDYRDFWVNNLSFKKDFMLRHGMFHSWPPASHEDLELGYRLQTCGMRLLFCEDALAYHHHPETIDSVSRRSYAQGYHWRLFEKHVPDLWIRRRSGNFRPGDGIEPRLRFWSRNAARAALFNGLTVPTLVAPMIRKSDSAGWLAPLVPLCAGKVASYYFRKGYLDSRRGAAFSPP